MDQQYDVIVIGAGSGGLTAAVGFSKVGKRVLLIEREHMGGECTNTGCIPSKALLHHAREFHTARTISGETTKNEQYRTEAFSYVRNIIADVLAEETPETFTRLGIEVVLGEAEFVGQHSVAVGETTYSYRTAIIATGTSPRLIDVPGLQAKRVLTNQNLFELETVPEKLLIIGGGPIGMEMAQAFAMLGSQVTIAEQSDTFARLEDAAIRPILRQSFESLGITIKTGVTIDRVDGDTAHFTVPLDGVASDTFTSRFDKILLAIGRVPNLPIGLTTANIKANEHSILVDNQYRTNNKHVYAIGDVAQRLKFTHTADDTARQVVARVTSKGILRVTNRKAVPKVTYTQPEIAQVGMSWADAVAKYTEEQLIRIEVPFSQNDRATTDSTSNGLLVVIAKRLSGTVLGAHIIGPTAGEIISIFSLAIDQKISLWKLQKIIFPYPTYSLIIKKSTDQFVGQQITNLTSDLKTLIARHTPKFLAAAIWITLIVALNQYQSAQGLTTTETAINLFNIITMTFWGPLLYVLIYAIRPVTFFPATALTILAGVFFGLVWGTVLTIIAATLAAAVAYLVGRFFGANLKLENSALGSYVTALHKHTFSAVLTMRLVFLPFDLTSYAAGILRTKFVPFVAATFLGIILGTTTFVSIGASLDVAEFRTNGFSFDLFEPRFLLLSLLIFVVSIGVSRLLKRKKAEV